ncbi:hypothetical protein LQG66_15510 [Bradyrhizobium ontarionense]|uniref:Uncharacterized protein n=1 Tax=Bradyrhizobium ontarionense TaxID=2898149 RepID=A0ABY3RKL4_9BRAD|nr:hypothetical protein [Bradyrhizobium sp. A19]UFZ07622.1 hypothetical protein LQG66_15510 [Bradyrhizobium sp. A19]
MVDVEHVEQPRRQPFLGGGRCQLLQLIDHDDDRGIRIVGDEGTQRRAKFVLRLEVLADLARSPWPRRRRKQGRDRFRKLRQRLQRRPDRREHQPAAGIQPQPWQNACPKQRRLAGAGGSEHDQCTRGGAKRRQIVNAIENGADVLLASEVDAGVVGVEGGQTRVGRPRRIPGHAVVGANADGLEPGQEPREHTLPVDRRRLKLGIAKDRRQLGIIEQQGDDRTAQGLGMSQLGEAPFRIVEVLADERDDCRARPELLIEQGFPLLPGKN